MNITDSDLEKIGIRMEEARDILCARSDEEVFDWHSDFSWMTDYLYKECAPESKKDVLHFLETLAVYKYSFEMNGEDLPKTDMALFGDGFFTDQYMPNWVYGFLSIVPREMEPLWGHIFCELYRYKFCLDMGLPFSEWKDVIAKVPVNDGRMLFVERGQLN